MGVHTVWKYDTEWISGIYTYQLACWLRQFNFNFTRPTAPYFGSN